VNIHHKRAAVLFGSVLAAVVLLGAVFGAADHCGTWNGIYFGVTTVTTVGYGDVIPRGWAAHLLAVAIMILIIPLWTGAFSLVTTGFTADHIDTRHRELKDAR
jgi:voltage-gated potassium channel Kch